MITNPIVCLFSKNIYMIPVFKKNIINDILKKKNKLVFIHTPKCGGMYVATILKDIGIRNKGHVLAERSADTNFINFTVIRNPIDRFESLLNYRLDEKLPRSDWPKHLVDSYENINMQLNEIVNRMSDAEIIGFKPYNSLSHWGQNVDIFITIDELKEFLEMFGYHYNENDYKKINVSKKQRGTLDMSNRRRIAKLYDDDMKLFYKWTQNK
jgi:hypothetical protein